MRLFQVLKDSLVTDSIGMGLTDTYRLTDREFKNTQTFKSFATKKENIEEFVDKRWRLVGKCMSPIIYLKPVAQCEIVFETDKPKAKPAKKEEAK